MVLKASNAMDLEAQVLDLPVVLGRRFVIQEGRRKNPQEVQNSVLLSQLRRDVVGVLGGEAFRPLDSLVSERTRLEHLLMKVKSANELAATIPHCRGVVRMKVVHWDSLAKTGIPRWPSRHGHDSDGIVDAENLIVRWLERCDEFGTIDGLRLSIEMFSHRWLRPHYCDRCASGEPCEFSAHAHPDKDDIKATLLTAYGHYFASRMKMCTKYFWIDFACIHQDDQVLKAVGVCLLPLYVGACQRIIFCDDTQFETRAWTRLERLIGACFCDDKSVVRLTCTSQLGICSTTYCTGKRVNVDGPWSNHIYMRISDPREGNITAQEDRDIVTALMDMAGRFFPNMWNGGWIRVSSSFQLNNESRHMEVRHGSDLRLHQYMPASSLTLWTTWPVHLPLGDTVNRSGSTLEVCTAPFQNGDLDHTDSLSVRRMRSLHRGITSEHRPQHPLCQCRGASWWWIMGIVLMTFSSWMFFSTWSTCEAGTRQGFWWWALAHAGSWFWISLTAMSAMFNIILLDGDAVWHALMAGAVGSTMGLISGVSALYYWHIVGHRKDGRLETSLVSKTIIIICVGIFGMVLFSGYFIRLGYVSDKGRHSLPVGPRLLRRCLPRWPWLWYVLRKGMYPILLSIMWCALWLTSETFSLFFRPFIKMASGVLAPAMIVFVEAAYVSLWSIFFLPQMRRLMGYVERAYLPEASNDEEEKFFHVSRVLNWTDMLFDCFHWQYKRLVFDEASTTALCLLILRDFASACYNFGWKFSPKEIAMRLAYMGKKTPVPVLHEENVPRVVHAVRRLLGMFQAVDAANSGLFISTYIRIDLISGRYAFMKDTRCLRRDEHGVTALEKDGVQVIANISVLNYRFLVTCDQASVDVSRCSSDRTSSSSAVLTKQESSRLPLSDFMQVIDMTLDEADGRLRKSVVQPIQELISLRFAVRYTAKPLSSSILLVSSLIMAFTNTQLFLDAPGHLYRGNVKVWAFPLVMLLVDLLELFTLARWHRRWIMMHEVLVFFRHAALDSPLFLIALGCLLCHTSMSPVLGMHMHRFC